LYEGREAAMEQITSRKNPWIQTLRALAADASARRAQGLFLCDGQKTLSDALHSAAAVDAVFWKGSADSAALSADTAQYLLPPELYDYVCPLKNSPGPLFTVRIPERSAEGPISNAIVLENVQDPGNVGTVIRTANAFQIGAVILCGSCADLYSPKTVRATMGAIFRQRVLTAALEELPALLKHNGLPLYAAALSARAQDIHTLDLHRSAVAVGSEGRGLSEDFLALCDGQLIIPMNPDSESLNAAVAASVIMWEMFR